MDRGIESVLHLEKIVFDTIEFKRVGFSSDKELELEIQSNVAQKEDAEVYKITLTLKGKNRKNIF